MKNPRKLIIRILISTSVILILLIGLFIFVIKKNGITEFDKKKTDYQPTAVKTEKTTPEFERGKEIFTADCNVCHKRRSTIGNKYIKRTIENVGIDYFKLFLTKQDSLVKSKDIYAIKLKEEFNNAGNSHNFDYSENELNSLIEYLK